MWGTRRYSANDMLSPMSSLLHSMHDWWITHPGWTNFIYFVIALLVSLYTDTARWILRLPVHFPALRIARFMEKDLDNQIVVLRYMHTDTFHLVHYLAFYSLHSLFMILRWAIIGSILNAVLFYHGHFAQIGVTSFVVMMFGGLVARMMRLQLTLGYLFDYDKSIADLEALRNKYPPLPSIKQL
jgi:hypothetical protein